MELTIEQLLLQGVAAHKNGKLQDAERFYRSVLQSQPLHPDANHNLGVLAVSFNKISAALPLFKTALEANPKIEQFWASYIDALIKENQFVAARQAIEQAKKNGVIEENLNFLKAQIVPTTQIKNADSPKPSQKQLSNLLRYYQTRRFVDAEKVAISITHKFPDHQFAWKVLGSLFAQSGRYSEAANANQTAVELSPKDAEAHSNLGNTLQELGRLEEAEASCREAIALKPDFAEAHSNLGVTLKELDRLEEAEASYKEATKLKPDFAEAHNNLGVTLQKLNRLEDAEASCRQAIALKPNFAEAHYNLGVTLQEIGKFDEAETNYTQAIMLKPYYSKAHRRLTLIKKYAVQDEQYLKMQELYSDKNISKEQRCDINFGLAKALEDLGEFEQAYRHYNEGNALRKELLNYDINQDLVLFKQIKSNYPLISKNSLAHEKLTKDLVPVFIVGMPRSGTTLVEQIISSHPNITGAGELPFVTEFGASIARGLSNASEASFLNFRLKYLSKLHNRAKGNLTVTDKMPQNFLYLGLLSAVLPEAKIIHVKRSPAAVCWANYKRYFASKNIGYCYNLDDMLSYYKLYENLMEFWKQSLSKKIYSLDYELLVENQESETRKLIHYIDLDWDEKCLSPENNRRSVATTSNVQVREKVYQGSSQKWKNYAPFLNGALDELLAT